MRGISLLLLVLHGRSSSLLACTKSESGTPAPSASAEHARHRTAASAAASVGEPQRRVRRGVAPRTRPRRRHRREGRPEEDRRRWRARRQVPVGVRRLPAECGTKPLPDCPLQAWMKANANPPVMTSDLPALAIALDKIVGVRARPATRTGHRSPRTARRRRATGDLAAAKASCRTCHDQYKHEVQDRDARARKISSEPRSCDRSRHAAPKHAARSSGARRVGSRSTAGSTSCASPRERAARASRSRSSRSSLKVTERSVRRYLRELDGTKPEQDFELLESLETTQRRPASLAHPAGRARTRRLAAARAGVCAPRDPSSVRGPSRLGALRRGRRSPSRRSRRSRRRRSAHQARRRSPVSSGLEGRFFFVPAHGAKLRVPRRGPRRALPRRRRSPRPALSSPRPRGRSRRAERIVFHPYAMVVHQGAIVLVGARAQGGRPNRRRRGRAIRGDDGPPHERERALRAARDVRRRQLRSRRVRRRRVPRERASSSSSTRASPTR